ncbi:MAG: division/cell wall cluster transcriptional repressor MraZ [Lachnospiraceae bacterium]|nr:division/cell wall cluster transcriptional repressor MraZ [Lachnospiraceae bacterium]
MFMGEYSHTIDAKGRLIIPAKFREGLGEQFVVTRGFDGCLFAYDMEKWGDMTEKLKLLPPLKRETRRLIRFFLAGAAEVEYDKQGRILLPQPLRAHADLTKEVVLVGAGDRVEIWDQNRWQNEEMGDIDDIAESLGDLVFS